MNFILKDSESDQPRSKLIKKDQSLFSVKRKSKTAINSNKDKGYQRYIKATKNKSKNNNNKNNNSNRRSVSETLINSSQGSVKKVSSEYPFNSINVENELMPNENILIDQIVPSFMQTNYADGILQVDYDATRHVVLVDFRSITNLTENFTLRNVRAVVEVYVGEKKLLEKHSSKRIKELLPGCVKGFKFKLKKQLKRNIPVELVFLSVSIIGCIDQISPADQLLGGALINLAYHIE